jgi:hypothetical protein
LAAISLLLLASGDCQTARMSPRVEVPRAGTPTETTLATTSAPLDARAPQEASLRRGTAVETGDSVENAQGGALPMVSPETTPAMTEARESDTSFTDPEIVAVTRAALRAERRIAAAGLESESVRARRLASVVLADSSTPLLDELAPLAAEASATSVAIAKSADAVARSIEATSGRERERVLLRALESEERQIVHLLDDELIHQAKSSSLRVALEHLRAALFARLEEIENVLPSRRW